MDQWGRTTVGDRLKPSGAQVRATLVDFTSKLYCIEYPMRGTPMIVFITDGKSIGLR